MCLITKQLKPITTTEDITVYKVLEVNNMAQFQPFEWELNKLVTANIKESDNPLWYDSMSCHEEFIDNYENTPEGMQSYINTGKIKAFGEGIHFFSNDVRAKGVITSSWGFLNLAQCLIPKGSKVYYDESDLGVTNQLKIVKIKNTVVL